MICLVSENLRDVTPERLPPRRREGPARVLFVNCNILGLKTVAINLKRFCETHEGIDAVHIDLVGPWWLKALGKSLPGSRGWDFHSYRHLRLWGPVIGRWLRGPLSLEHFDVVQVMTQGNAWAMPKLMRETEARFVLKIDGTAMQDVTDYGFARATRAPFIAAERKMFAAADLVVSDTHWANGSVHADYGIPRERIYRASNAVDIPARSRWDVDAGPRDGPVRIAFVGNAWKRKGGDLLLSAHQRCLADRAELHVIGGVKAADPDARNVTWHGRVPRDKLLGEMLPSMDVFVLPSRVDMAPFASVEAAATGLPLVVPRLAGFPEVVDHERTGLLFETGSEPALAEALTRLVDDAALRERMGRAARAHVREHFDSERVYPDWLDRIVALADEGERE